MSHKGEPQNITDMQSKGTEPNEIQLDAILLMAGVI